MQSRVQPSEPSPCVRPASACTSPWKAERKALRGMGAAHNQLGQHDRALDYMKQARQPSMQCCTPRLPHGSALSGPVSRYAGRRTAGLSTELRLVFWFRC
jgi:hypothetical protein